MFQPCTHTHESGSTCKSPAVRGTSLCFQHTPHQPIKRRQPDEYQPFELGPLHSKTCIVGAITVVLNRLARRQIKCSEADTFLRGFSLLGRLMTEVDESPADYEMERDEMNRIPSADSSEEEVTDESIQETLDEIADGLGLEMPTLKEMQALQASMPNGTPEKALEHWIATGRIRPKDPRLNDDALHIAARGQAPSKPSIHP